MLKENEVIEEFQSSSWGHIRIREAISIAKDLTEGKNVYVFKKKRSREDTENTQTFIEGWVVSNIKPNYYHSIGSCVEEREPEQLMVTLRSKSERLPDGTWNKIPKENFKPDTRFWSMWYNFNQMFGDVVVTRNKTGEVVTKDMNKLMARIKHWDNLLSRADGRPMLGVLGRYTGEELERVISLTKAEMCDELDKLKQLIDDPQSKFFDAECSTILTTGIDGRIKTARARLIMRYSFWKEWNETRDDVFSLAKTYSLTTTKWDNY